VGLDWRVAALPAVVVLAALGLGCGRGAPLSGAAGSRPDGGAGAGAGALAARTPWGATVVARVGEGVVTGERLAQRLNLDRLEADRQGRARRDARAVLDALVDEEILVQEALRLGFLATDDDVRDRLVRRVIQTKAARDEQLKPTAAELRQFHQAHRAEFPAEERLHVRHLLVKVPAGATPAAVEVLRRRAEGLRREAAKGKPEAFDALVRQHSDDPTKGHGGDLGYLPLARWTVLFGADAPAALATTPAGGLAPLVRSRQGFHVIQVVDRQGKGADPLVVQRREILGRYLREVTEKRRGDMMAELRRGAQIAIDGATLEAVITGRIGPAGTAVPAAPAAPPPAAAPPAPAAGQARPGVVPPVAPGVPAAPAAPAAPASAPGVAPGLAR
jgi:parvulin-like peptidyl-prolyl isomerase